MTNTDIAILGQPGYAKGIGKVGTASDITFYNLKRGDDTVTLIEPTRYPERLAPLFYAVSLADAALLVINEITPSFGEMVVMLDVMGIQKGYIILQNYLDPSRIMPLVQGTVVANYAFLEDNAIELREHLLNEASGKESGEGDAREGVVFVDHHFNVKGIGTVVLGSVERGTIRKHDILNVLPGTTTAQIRSIQKHDDDYDEAHGGDRVGLALKNIDAEELDRGYVLTRSKEVVTTDAIRGDARLVRYWQEALHEGMVVHVGHWMQFVPARIESVYAGEDWRAPVLSLSLEKELVYLPGDTAVLHYLDGGKLRIAGSMRIE
ncbi:MAG: EF-Tu/IF-2/RF-3 family GTPase [Methanomicrobiaceae archaeon]|nr:EF-Tu/IF-2/RF-3 family GTPase [Methanomicrobiaceae archaeon]